MAGSHAERSLGIDARFAKPDTLFFGIGAQKSGTTWLSEFLYEHPEVCAPAWKEQNYWSVVDGEKTAGRNLVHRKRQREKLGTVLSALRDIGWSEKAKRNRSAGLAIRAADNAGAPHSVYADAVFDRWNPRKHLCAGEISPAYASLSAETFAQMFELGPNVRFVYLMRDPVSRFLSGIRHALRKEGAAETLTQTRLDAEIDRAIEGGQESGHLRHSRYDLVIARMEKAIPQEHIAYFFFETLFDQSEIERLCRFLGVSSVPANLNTVVHEGRGKHVNMSARDRARAALALEPCYRAIGKKFGSAVPDAWTKSLDLLEGREVA
jgi:hypothetical protein